MAESRRPARRVVETLLTIPWAVSEDWGRRMLAIALRQSPDAIAGHAGELLETTRAVSVREGVATIPIVGPMFRYADLFSEISGATSYEALARDLTTALEDPAVRAIVLDIDSPGGEVFGAAELSDLIFNARGTKPIVAHVGGYCCSAALWIASAADEVVTTSVGILGSVGAMMSITVPNPDRQAELFGKREIEFISSQSPNKNVDPTSKAGKEQYLAIVDHIAGVFIADLARNYGITEAKVAGKFGHGGIMVGADAVKAGMAHRVATFEATHQALADERPRTVFDRPRRMASTSARLTELLQSVHLEQAVRPAAVLRGWSGPVVSARAAAHHTPDDGMAVADSPAPKADHMEDRRMPELPAAAPVSGAPDELSAFKARFESITNLCAVAGVPERAAEYIRSTKTETEISAELLAFKRTQAAPAVPVTIPGEIRGTVDRAADRVFADLGENLLAIAAAGAPHGVNIGGFRGGNVDPRLLRLNAAATGAGTAVGGDGGFMVQTDFTVDLMKDGLGADEITRRCDPTELAGSADSLRVVTLDETSRATGSRWGGIQVYWTDEGGEGTPKKPKIGFWESKLAKLMGLGYATDELLQDARAMGQVFSEGFRDEMGFVVGDAIYRGTGVGQPLGILNAACTVSVAKESGQAADTIVAANLTKMWAKILPRAKRRGVWFINTECTPQLDALSIAVGTGGELVYMPAGGLSDSPFGRLKGRPVIEIEQAAALGDTGDIVFADLNYYKLITKGGVSEAESMHVRFIYDEMTFRWTLRINGAPKIKSAITPYKGASGATLSPFVKLDAR